ncbi:MAG: hypothetical protein OXO53_03465 [Chloroflexota bacterium]|nr:hypothetical protein [Chloroflexota bacterium]
MDRLEFEYSDGGAENEAVPKRSQGCSATALANYTRRPYRECLSLLGGLDDFGGIDMDRFDRACRLLGITPEWNEESRAAGSFSLARAHVKYGDCIAVIGNDTNLGHITAIRGGLLLDKEDWQDRMERELWWVLAIYQTTTTPHPMGEGFVGQLL